MTDTTEAPPAEPTDTMPPEVPDTPTEAPPAEPEAPAEPAAA